MIGGKWLVENVVVLLDLMIFRPKGIVGWDEYYASDGLKSHQLWMEIAEVEMEIYLMVKQCQKDSECRLIMILAVDIIFLIFSIFRWLLSITLHDKTVEKMHLR